MISKLVSPQMMKALGNFYNTVVTIETLTNTQNPQSGQNVRSYVPVGTMTALKCYIEPASPSSEVRRPDQTLVENTYKIALQRYHPEIKVTDHARTDDNRLHNILSVDNDDTHTVTFLTTEIING